MENGKIIVKNKGVSGSNKFKIEQFEGMLSKTIDDIYTEQFTIKSFKHVVNTVKYSKKSLSKEEDIKRYPILKKNAIESTSEINYNWYETLALGHHLTYEI